MKYFNTYTVILLLLLSSGCDNSMNAFDEEEGLYSIYGYLDLHEDINYIRIKDINETLQDSDGVIDAKVTFENLDNSTSEILQDTVVEFDGVKTHNFRTTLDINPDTEYRVTAERSDGKTASATAITPYIAETSVNPMGENCSTTVNIDFEPVRSKNSLWVDVGFYYNQDLFWVPINTLLIEIGNKVNATFTPMMLINEAFEGETIYCFELSDDTFEVRYTHYGPGIYEEAVSDSIGIPGGSGRFGAFYKDSFSFPIDTTGICPPSCNYRLKEYD